ncbi:glucose-6-phosphate isomerase [Altererythrobacter sp. ZODW24]|uniref:glucose-6-phosphate isomerase n=1 Tax=Altererythrobacter sp. ZODW24 TaxID=2185142 RepID=UPI000DF73BFC|nr:glucose-6-phosphate isomerase [Altererythrobacter sp. ZODW24]
MSEAVEQVWSKLEKLDHTPPLDLFAKDADRLKRLSTRLEWPSNGKQVGAIFDWSKTHLSAENLPLFEELAKAANFTAHRDELLNGEIVNVTEGRAATHTAERGIGADQDVAQADALHMRMRGLVEAIHQGILGEVKHLIHIGIGGSALGPKLAVDALGRDGCTVDVHVVSNIDGLALEAAFDACDPATTMIALASKTFTTIETMTNAESALTWLRANGVDDAYGRVVALTANPEAAVEWGVDETRVLPFAESVGGRYSLWSSIGFPVAIALGWDDYAAMLEGAGAVDAHFRDTDGATNLPLRAAFADRLYARLLGAQTRAVFAYDERMRFFPDYLQQLEMESNGKRVTAEGEEVTEPTAPITWGGVGTDGQHAVFQLLHQGTHLIPVDFIASIAPGDTLDPAHHRILLTNCFAQGAALMAGEKGEDTARDFPGGRPSATILCDDIDPATFGALVAFHEHRTFANAVLMGINPFDQFGVELGKKMAKSIDAGGGEFDASTSALLDAAGLG